MVALQTFIEVRACVCVCPSVMFDLYLYTRAREPLRLTLCELCVDRAKCSLLLTHVQVFAFVCVLHARAMLVLLFSCGAC